MDNLCFLLFDLPVVLMLAMRYLFPKIFVGMMTLGVLYLGYKARKDRRTVITQSQCSYLRKMRHDPYDGFQGYFSVS